MDDIGNPDSVLANDIFQGEEENVDLDDDTGQTEGKHFFV